MAEILDGKALSNKIRLEIKEELTKLYVATDKRCSLAVVMIGDNPASAIYVRNKIKACEEVGFKSVAVKMPAETTQEQAEEQIKKLNQDPNIFGILVQLPLPKHLNEKKLLKLISVEKDIDGFSAENVGKLTLGEDALFACTPNGVIQMLKAYNIAMSGKNAVVIGRSNIVGKPMALLLLKENCTVTVCHSKTQNLADFTKNADILVCAIGIAKFVKADMVKKGAVVVDVGMDRDENGKLCGDVDFDAVKEVSSYITPVPGGVGPMTITMLMYNTLQAFKSSL